VLRRGFGFAPGERVLVVEDDPSIGANLERALENSGYGVTLVTSVADTLAVVESPDLVLLDLGLPDLEGVDVIRRIRREATTPIIILSARGDERDKIDGLEAGADDYVTKPFRLRELIARVRAGETRFFAQLVTRYADPQHVSDQIPQHPFALNEFARELDVGLASRTTQIVNQRRDSGASGQRFRRLLQLDGFKMRLH